LATLIGRCTSSSNQEGRADRLVSRCLSQRGPSRCMEPQADCVQKICGRTSPVLSIQAEERHLQISDTVVAFGSIKTWRSAAGPGLWENRGVSDAQTTTLRIVELKPQETAPHGENAQGAHLFGSFVMARHSSPWVVYTEPRYLHPKCDQTGPLASHERQDVSELPSWEGRWHVVEPMRAGFGSLLKLQSAIPSSSQRSSFEIHGCRQAMGPPWRRAPHTADGIGVCGPSATQALPAGC
jgi:hypothetical protein